MFVILWYALAVNGPMIRPIVFESYRKFSSVTDCETYRQTAELRMPDYIRGQMNAPLEADIRVQGKCQPAGEPT